MSDIPGFYYDESKKKYFKILENKFSATTGVYTKEKVDSYIIEQKRKNDLMTGEFLVNENVKNINIYSSIKKRQLKGYDNDEYQVNQKIFSGLKSNSVADLGYFSHRTPSNLSFRLKVTKNQKSLVLSCNSDVKNCIGFHDITHPSNPSATQSFSNTHKNCRKLDLALVAYSYEYNSSLVDVISIKDDLVVAIGNSLALCDKAMISMNRVKNEVASNYYVDRLVNCLTSTGTNKIVVGSSEGALIIDITHSGIQYYQKFNIMALTPLKSINQDSDVVLMGLRRGGVLSCDLRSSSRPCKVLTSRHIAVNYLHSLDDASSFLCSFSDGKFLNVDLRNGKTITQYNDHKNDYITTPLSVDPTQKFVCSVGVDCYTRVWDIREANPLSVIPPPISATRSSMPASCFLPTLQTTIPGILLLLHDMLYLYTL